MEGQVGVFMPGAEMPCYACLYPEDTTLDESCVNSGVLGPAAGIIGSVQALETIKVLLGIGRPLYARLLLFDGAAMEWRELSIPKRNNCPVCSSHE